MQISIEDCDDLASVGINNATSSNNGGIQYVVAINALDSNTHIAQSLQ